MNTYSENSKLTGFIKIVKLKRKSEFGPFARLEVQYISCRQLSVYNSKFNIC